MKTHSPGYGGRSRGRNGRPRPRFVPQGRRLAERLIDPRPGPESAAQHRLLREAVEQALRSVPARERQVVVLAYGLCGGPFLGRDNIAAVTGYPRERVRRLERMAIYTLRTSFRCASLLEPFLED